MFMFKVCVCGQRCVCEFKGVCVEMCVWQKKETTRRRLQEKKNTDKARREQERESKTRNKMMIFLFKPITSATSAPSFRFLSRPHTQTRRAVLCDGSVWHFDRLTVFPLVLQQDLFQLLLAKQSCQRMTRQDKFKRKLSGQQSCPILLVFEFEVSWRSPT